MTLDLRAGDVRPVGAADFALSKAFYVALGWQVEYDDGGLALLANGAHRFYLQDHYAREWVEAGRPPGMSRRRAVAMPRRVPAHSSLKLM